MRLMGHHGRGREPERNQEKVQIGVGWDGREEIEQAIDAIKYEMGQGKLKKRKKRTLDSEARAQRRPRRKTGAQFMRAGRRRPRVHVRRVLAKVTPQFLRWVQRRALEDGELNRLLQQCDVEEP